MKDEEMAEQYAQNLEKELMKEYEEHLEYGQTPYLATIPTPHAKQAFLAGLKAGRPQWHDLRKDKNDLPKDKHNVWCKCLDECGEGWYDKDTNTWTLIYKGYHVHCIEAWCEIPTFDKE